MSYLVSNISQFDLEIGGVQVRRQAIDIFVPDSGRSEVEREHRLGRVTFIWTPESAADRLGEEDVAALEGGFVTINGDVTITPENAADYRGKVVTFANAATITISEGCSLSMLCKTPSSGNASIARAGTVTLNDAATTQTRARSQLRVFSVFESATDRYEVTE